MRCYYSFERRGWGWESLPPLLIHAPINIILLNTIRVFAFAFASQVVNTKPFIFNEKLNIIHQVWYPTKKGLLVLFLLIKIQKMRELIYAYILSRIINPSPSQNTELLIRARKWYQSHTCFERAMVGTLGQFNVLVLLLMTWKYIYIYIYIFFWKRRWKYSRTWKKLLETTQSFHTSPKSWSERSLILMSLKTTSWNFRTY